MRNWCEVGERCWLETTEQSLSPGHHVLRCGICHRQVKRIVFWSSYLWIKTNSSLQFQIMDAVIRFGSAFHGKKVFAIMTNIINIGCYGMFCPLKFSQGALRYILHVWSSFAWGVFALMTSSLINICKQTCPDAPEVKGNLLQMLDVPSEKGYCFFIGITKQRGKRQGWWSEVKG